MDKVHQKTVVVDGITPVAAYAALRNHAGDGSFLLESVVPGERWGRYSVLGYRPRQQIIVPGNPNEDPFTTLGQLLKTEVEGPQDIAARFAGARVGVINYDAVHYATKVDISGTPGMVHVAIYDEDGFYRGYVSGDSYEWTN